MRLVLAMLLVPLAGCAIQGGAALTRIGSFSDPHLPHVWTGHVATHARFMSYVVGPELEAVGSHNRWNGFTTGLQLGIAPVRESAPLEFVWLADVGVPAGWSSRGGGYFGSTIEVPIALEGSLPVTERNRNLRIISSPRTQLAPFLRIRCYFDEHGNFDDRLGGVSLGVALRVKYSTDLIDLGTR
jgi:hypothetical protein